jgi:hypothetical protein
MSSTDHCLLKVKKKEKRALHRVSAAKCSDLFKLVGHLPPKNKRDARTSFSFLVAILLSLHIYQLHVPITFSFSIFYCYPGLLLLWLLISI